MIYPVLQKPEKKSRNPQFRERPHTRIIHQRRFSAISLEDERGDLPQVPSAGSGDPNRTGFRQEARRTSMRRADYCSDLKQIAAVGIPDQGRCQATALQGSHLETVGSRTGGHDRRHEKMSGTRFRLLL